MESCLCAGCGAQSSIGAAACRASAERTEPAEQSTSAEVLPEVAEGRRHLQVISSKDVELS